MTFAVLSPTTLTTGASMPTISRPLLDAEQHRVVRLPALVAHDLDRGMRLLDVGRKPFAQALVGIAAGDHRHQLAAARQHPVSQVSGRLLDIRSDQYDVSFDQP